MLFSFTSFSLLALGLLRAGRQTFVNRLCTIALALSALLVVQIPESTMRLYNGIRSVGALSNRASILLCTLGIGLLLFGGNSFSQDSYPVFGVCSLVGGMLIISSNDLVTLFMGIELQSFGVYLLAASNRSSLSSTGAALKYFLLGALGTALILLGSTTQYRHSGTTSLITHFNLFSLTFLRAGRYFKVAAAPLHGWAPDVYDGVKSSVSAWLQVVPKVAIILFRIRVDRNLSYYLGILSIVVGSVYGVAQSRVRRLLAYSTVSHVGFLLLSSDQNTVLYLVSYSITTRVALFARHTLNDKGDLKDLAGLGKEMPALASSFAILLFSLAGVPPLFGFFAKARVLQELLGEGLYPVSIVAILCSVISAYYYLSLISLMFFSDGTTTVQPIGSLQAYLVSAGTGVVVYYIFAHHITINFLAVLTLSTIYALAILVPLLIAVLFLLNWVLATQEANPEKASAYECGFDAMQQTRQPFNIRYYLVAVRFLLLDLEVALLFPIVVSLSQEGSSLYGFVVVRVFLARLTIGFVYEFGKGALHIASQRASINRKPYAQIKGPVVYVVKSLYVIERKRVQAPSEPSSNQK